MTPAIVIIGLAFLAAAYAVSIYNNLVAFNNRLLNAFAQIEVQLKRRYDLIPNLVETAKAYLKHEAGTLEAVVEARNAAAKLLEGAKNGRDFDAVAALGGAEKALASALGKLNVVIEAYPQLKANENMVRLHEEISSTENRVSFARQAYNDFVFDYNTYRQSFPQNLLAARFGHKENASPLIFEDSKAIQSAPAVKF